MTRIRVAVWLLLPLLVALQGCRQLMPVEGPTPGQDIDGIVVRNRAILFSESAVVVVADSTVTVREGTRTKAYPAADIDMVLATRVDPGYTLFSVGVWLMSALFFGAACDDGVDGEFGGEEGEVWSMECADDDDDDWPDDDDDD